MNEADGLGLPHRLILVPTAMERELLNHRMGDSQLPEDVKVKLCGFGPIASAAIASQLINDLRPSEIMLVGIAGSYDDELKVGSAYSFSSIACDGVGVGQGESFRTASQMGWSHWSTDAETIGDEIQVNENGENRQLLTVCSASEGTVMVSDRRKRFPKASAEDMEAFSVAVACRLHGVPLHVVRGISNIAGDRDKANWRIKEAIVAAADLTSALLG